MFMSFPCEGDVAVEAFASPDGTQYLNVFHVGLFGNNAKHHSIVDEYIAYHHFPDVQLVWIINFVIEIAIVVSSISPPLSDSPQHDSLIVDLQELRLTAIMQEALRWASRDVFWGFKGRSKLQNPSKSKDLEASCWSIIWVGFFSDHLLLGPFGISWWSLFWRFFLLGPNHSFCSQKWYIFAWFQDIKAPPRKDTLKFRPKWCGVRKGVPFAADISSSIFRSKMASINDVEISEGQVHLWVEIQRPKSSDDDGLRAISLKESDLRLICQ